MNQFARVLSAVLAVGGVCVGQTTAPVPQEAAPAPATKPAMAVGGDIEGGVTKMAAGTRVKLVIPKDWKRTKVMSGFCTDDKTIEVGTTEYPIPAIRFVGQVAPGGPMLAGYVEDRRELARIEGRDAVLVRGTLPADSKGAVGGIEGGEVRYWLLFGNASSSVLVSAHYPKVKEAELDTLVRNVVLSAMWETSIQPDVVDRFPFTFTPPESLKLGGALAERVNYTKTGKLMPDKDNPTLFTVLSTPGSTARLTEEEARKRFAQIGGGKREVKVKVFSPLTIDGMLGYEGIATMDTATPPPEGAPPGAPAAAGGIGVITVYLAILTDAEAHYTFFGQTAGDETVKQVEEFKAAVRTVHRRADGGYTH